MMGNVFRWDERRRCGLIATRDEMQVFFHKDSFLELPEEIEIGMLLEFDVVKSPRGLRAVRIGMVETED